jgi:hypothetical protein
MIIKSMARKEPSFGQLIEYMLDIDKADQHYSVHQNLFSRNAEEIEQAFLDNAALMRKRKNGNYLYHEILSITKAEKLEAKEQKRILRDVAYEYARHRASENLVFGTLHDDHDNHLHYHLVISANALGEAKKTRLSKRQFDQLKKGMEQRVLETYPELEQALVINQEAGEKLSRKGAERKRRTGKVPERDALKAKLQAIFDECDTKEDFFAAFNKANLEFYVRGKTLGVKDLATDRNHRLKTLGMLDNFQALSDRIELDEAVNAEFKAAGTRQTEDKTDAESPAQTTDTQQAEVEASEQSSKQTQASDETAEAESSKEDRSSESSQTAVDAAENERTKRKAEMEAIRQQQAEDDEQTSHNQKDKQ